MFYFVPVAAIAVSIAAATVAVLAAQEPLGLTPGRAIERPIAGGESHVYRLALGAGEYAAIVVEQRGIDIAVQLLDEAQAPSRPADEVLFNVGGSRQRIGVAQWRQATQDVLVASLS